MVAIQSNPKQLSQACLYLVSWRFRPGNNGTTVFGPVRKSLLELQSWVIEQTWRKLHGEQFVETRKVLAPISNRASSENMVTLNESLNNRES